MKHFVIPALLLSAISISTQAQFTVGADGFFIKGSTPVNLNGLTFTPSPGNLTLVDKTLTMSATPIAGTPSSSIKRVYSFNSPVNFSGAVGIFYLPDPPFSELNGNTEATLQISYSTTAAGNFFVTAGGTQSPATNYVSNNVVNTDLSSVTAVNGSSVLPVTLLNFTVRKEGRSALMAWTTTAETNSWSFEIQHSGNARNWETIGEVMAKGESQEKHEYSFTDTNPADRMTGANHYYRLKMLDQDGSFALSAIRMVSLEVGSEASVYPNPTAGKMKIRIDDWTKVESIQITNLQGMVMYDIQSRKTLGSDPLEVDIKSLPSGTYLVKINRTGGSVHALKLLRQ